MPSREELRAKREQIVREHMDSENRHEFDAALATFSHPRYELIATGEVYDGEAEVSEYYQLTRRAFPDQRNELLDLHHADDAVLVEAVVRGTHSGPLRSLPPTGRSFELPILAVFLFEGEDLICERVYFDQSTVLRQLRVARDPLSLLGRLGTAVSHPLTITRGVLRGISGR
jgi:steroid delta-isomerase-like uncharacterized protein